MSELHITNYNGVEVVDSREVAEMVDKSHQHLLRDIRSYIDIMEEATESNFGLGGGQSKVGQSDSSANGGRLKIEPSEFFLESSYVNAQNKIMPCYLITKKVCDMIANKLTGRKGVLFTAAYVTAFEEMRGRLAHVTPDVSPNGLARLITKSQEIMLAVGKTNFDVYAMMQSVYYAWNVPMPEQFYKPERDPAADQLTVWESAKLLE